MATHKWNHCYPAMMAGFPANALLFRRNYLKQASPAVVGTRTLASMFDREPPQIADNDINGYPVASSPVAAGRVNLRKDTTYAILHGEK